MNKKEFKEIYKKYNEFETLPDRFKFCIEILKPCKCIDISKDCGIPLSTITRIKNGMIDNPNRIYSLLISRYFNVNELWLFNSKYFPVSEEEYNKKCLKLSTKEQFTDVIETPSKDGKMIISKDYKQLGNDLLAFCNYRELLPIILDLIETSNYVNSINDDNESFLINEINLLKNKNKETNESLQDLAKKTRNVNISEEELLDIYNKYIKQLAKGTYINLHGDDDIDEENEKKNK